MRVAVQEDERKQRPRGNNSLVAVRVLVVYLLALVMFAFRHWCRRMNDKEGSDRPPRSALNLDSGVGRAARVNRSASVDRHRVYVRGKPNDVVETHRTAILRQIERTDRGPIEDTHRLVEENDRVVEATGIQARCSRRKNLESRRSHHHHHHHVSESYHEQIDRSPQRISSNGLNSLDRRDSSGSASMIQKKTCLEDRRRPRRGSKSALVDSTAIKGETRSSSTSDRDSSSEGASSCNCGNCRSLLRLTECGVCWECLQGGQICACPVCANVVCSSCSARLSTCPFCRSTEPRERDRALERLVDALKLPCRNARSGCDSLLDGESRFAHESMCSWATIGCPVGRGGCSWQGTVASVQAHLLDKHQLQPLHDHGISVEIHSFRNKASAHDGRVYTVCLCCFGQLFVVRLVLYEGRLRLCFTRLGPCISDGTSINSSTTTTNTGKILDANNDEANSRFGVSVTIRARSGRRLRGLVPFGRFDRDCRELSISCDSLYPPTCSSETHHSKKFESSSDVQQSRIASQQQPDLVKIDLLLKRLDRH